MDRHPESTVGRADSTVFRNELLGRLGLTANAGDQDIETAYNGLVEFLEVAPHKEQRWAAARVRDLDEAFALLSGPEEDLTAAAAAQTVATAQDEPDETSSAPAAAPGAFAAFAAFAADKRRRTQALWAIVPLLVVAIVLGVFFMGKSSDVPGISGKPTGQSTTAAAGATPVDKAKVAALMKKINANPKDKASLLALGELYFGAADYKNASVWEQQVLAIDPKNQVALLALGAAQFNLGNAPEAKKQWLVAAALYPNLAEVHYDLGFLYYSQTPPDKARMTAEWNKVIAIDPNSDIAKTVATHLKSSKNPASSGSATPSAK